MRNRRLIGVVLGGRPYVRTMGGNYVALRLLAEVAS